MTEITTGPAGDSLAVAAAKKKAKKRKKRPRPRCRIVKKTKLVRGKRTTVRVRKCRPKKKPVTPGKTHPVVTVPGGGSGAPAPAAPPAPPRLQVIQSPIPVYAGAFGRAQAERLLWRAGFGPASGQADALATLDLEAAVMALTRPQGVPDLIGPHPTVGGAPLNVDQYYGAVLYWLDRMVRSSHQLVERLALVFHDWWATNNDSVGSNRFMLDQTNIFREHGLGSFRDMVKAVTRDPAMLLFLNGLANRKGAINENYARELMELFTLGADRGAYTETDVRELARALSGWTASYDNGYVNFRWDEQHRWDPGVKTVFGRSGRFTPEDACNLVVDHPMHASYFVRKLWSAFIPVPPGDSVAAALEQHYVASGLQIRPIVEAILCSPEFYEGPRMVKPPVVLAAGMMRARGVGIDSERWWSATDAAGQRIYYPPDVSGWNDARWLDTNTVRGRWDLVASALQGGGTVAGGAQNAYPAETAEDAVRIALEFWGNPAITAETIANLQEFAATCLPADPSASRRAQRQNALRHLIAGTPDYQTC